MFQYWGRYKPSLKLFERFVLFRFPVELRFIAFQGFRYWRADVRKTFDKSTIEVRKSYEDLYLFNGPCGFLLGIWKAHVYTTGFQRTDL